MSTSDKIFEVLDVVGAVVREAIADYEAFRGGKMTAEEVLAKWKTHATERDANRAAEDSEIDKRFPTG